MDEASLKIKISGHGEEGKGLDYGLIVWANRQIGDPQAKVEKEFNDLVCTYSVGSIKLDKRYLLVTDKLFKKEKIFGIAEDFEEAEERVYRRSLELANEFKEEYKSKYKNVEISDETKYAKNLESKI